MLTAGDIAYNRIHSYEDWWIHPELIDINIHKLQVRLLQIRQLIPKLQHQQ